MLNIPRREYRIGLWSIVSLVFFMVALIAVGIISRPYVADLMARPDTATSMPAYYQYISYLPLAIAGFILLRIIYLATRRLTVDSEGIATNSQRLAWKDLTGFRETRVTHTYLFIPVGKSYHFALVFRNGFLNITNNYGRFAELADTLRMAAREVPGVGDIM